MIVNGKRLKKSRFKADVSDNNELSLEASGEFESHAIRPRSSHHMQVMTVEILWKSA